MKIISKFLFLFLLIFTLAGCGSFFGSEEAVGIASIVTEDLEDGSIKLIINYTDEELEPLEVILPRGEEGAKGNGIKEIKTESGDEVTKVIVTYTDTSMPALEFDVPHGSEIDAILVVDKDGYEIKTDAAGNDYRVDADGKNIEEEGKFFEGTKYLKVIYTETESPESETKKSSIFELPKGEKGQEGNGIEYIIAGKLLDEGKIEEGSLNEDGSITLKIKYTLMEEPQMITIPANKGIKEINKIDTPTSYGLEIIYTTLTSDGKNESKKYEFPKPKVTEWLYGQRDPDDYFDGKIGDYWYNTTKKSLWFKRESVNDPNGFGYWELIVNLGKDEQKCYITFNANGGSIVFGANGEDVRESLTYELIYGESFYSKGYQMPIPNPPSNDLVFAGWYTSDKVNPTTGKFTDLTIANTSITLYALWQEKQ